MKKNIELEIPKALNDFCELHRIKIVLNKYNPSRSYLIRMNNALSNKWLLNMIIVLIEARIVKQMEISTWIVLKEPSFNIDFISAKDREVLIGI